MNATTIRFPRKYRAPMATRDKPPGLGTLLLRWCMVFGVFGWCWALIVLALSL